MSKNNEIPTLKMREGDSISFLRANNARAIAIVSLTASWATFYYTSEGDIFIYSDWGLYAYRFGAYGDDFVAFLCSITIERFKRLERIFSLSSIKTNDHSLIIFGSYKSIKKCKKSD